MRKTIILLLLLPALLGSCHTITSLVYDDPVVAKVGKNKLHKSEVVRFIPNLVSPADSARLAEQYINSWAMDLLYLDVAERELSKEELDFRVEAAHTREFRERCITDPSVCSCPEVIDELTSERIFTMTYVRGHSIGDREAIEREGYDRLKIAQALFDNYVHQLLDGFNFQRGFGEHRVGERDQGDAREPHADEEQLAAP